VQRALSLADEHEHLTDAEFGEDQIAGFTDAASGPWPRSHEQVSFSSRSGPACGPAIQAQAGSVARSLHVLVADDSAMNREIAAAFLREAGHIVSLAESGAEAVSIAAAATLDLILMDVRMPEMDGLEATRHIRRLPGDNAVVPIIALTALSSAQDVDTCIKVGMNGHLTKPFSRETLNEVLTRAVPPRASRTGNLAIVHDPAGMPAAGAAMKRHGLESLARLAVHPEQSAAWRVAGARPDADPAPPAWLDIDNPWSRTSQRSRSSQQPRTPGGNFQIKLTAMTVKGRQRLFSGGLSCKPQAHRDQHGFHWLVFVDRDLATIGHFTVQCDLWRWVHGRWASATVAGAVFTPDEMFDQGWRYCGPCEDRAAQIEITARTRQDEPEPTS
jgi:CheY-like chemotaxis protein